MMRQYFSRYYKIILPLFLLLIFFSDYIHPTQELFVDLGGHLLRGHYMVQSHTVLTTNTFSYTNPSYPTVDLEWLYEILSYFVFSFLGINGLILLTTAVALFSVTILYTFTAKRNNNILVSILAACYLVILTQRSAVLPEVFSYLFVATFVVILYNFREKYTNLIWLLIPLELIWVNMHLYFIIGILLIGLFLFEAVLLFRKKYEGKYLKMLLIVLISTVLVSLVNPFGLAGLLLTLFPLTFAQNSGFSLAENANIFQNINGISQLGQSLNVQVFIVATILLVLVIIVNYKKIRPIDALISIMTIIGAAIAIRDLGIFVFVTFIPVTFIFNSLFEKYRFLSNKNLRNIVLLGFPVIATALSLWTFSQLGGLGLGATHGYENGVNFFLDNKLTGPIYNNYNIGSYFAYRVYPKEKFFVDTRPEAYPASFFRNVYIPMESSLKGFQAGDNHYHFNTLIFGYTNGLPNQVGLLQYLMNTSKEWKLVYLDDTTVIFIKNISQNEKIIQQYAMTDATFRLPTYQTFNSLYNLAHFLYFMNWKKSELRVFQRINELNPKDCTTIRNILGLSGYNPTNTQSDPTIEPYLADYKMYCQ